MASLLSQRLASLFSAKAKLVYACSLIEAGQPGRAFAPLSAAAAAGIPEAQFRVGRAYLDGAGVPISREEGARWMQRAAEAAHSRISGASGARNCRAATRSSRMAVV